MENLEYYTDLLKQNKLRATQPRILVLNVLIDNHHQFLSPEEILDIINSRSKKSCDRASVYRILNNFYQLKIISKSEFHGEATKYRLSNNEKKDEHIHYFKCIECENIEPLKGCIVAKKEKELLSQGYTQLSHHLEIKGICPNCS